MGEACRAVRAKRNTKIILVESLKGADHSENLNVDMRIILRLIYALHLCIYELHSGVWIGLIWLRTGTVEGSYEHNNNPSGPVTCWEYHD
jgi:hypothetical protein